MIHLEHISKIFDDGKDIGINDVSLTIADKEFITVVGPSGCGKSTLLKIIAGLLPPTKGTITTQQSIAMVFQNGALFPWLTVEENILVGVSASSIEHTQESKIRKAHHYGALMGLEEYRHKYPRDLSGGQRQRVGIARALATEADILLMDEPFSALDAKTTHELHEELLQIWKETGKTIIMVSHSIEEAVSLSERIIVMKNGAIASMLTVDMPYPRREMGDLFLHMVNKVRNIFFE